MAADFFIGESLVGEGNEVAHIDLIIGSKSGPAGTAFTHALSNQKDGFSTLLAVVTPNLAALVGLEEREVGADIGGDHRAERLAADLRGDEFPIEAEGLARLRRIDHEVLLHRAHALGHPGS